MSAASSSRGSLYAHVRPGLDIEAPPTRYSAYDPVTNRQLLLVDDLSETVGARFGTILTRRLTREMAEDVVDTLAGLRIAFWAKPLQRMHGTWLWDSYDFQDTINVTIGAEARTLSGFERGREVIPARLLARRDEVHAAHMRSLEINTTGPQTMLHSDVHPGNWYVTRDGRMGLCDWQCVVQGGWARDIAYALSSGLEPEDRRAWEADLVARHGKRLADAGISPPSFDEAFLAYRQQMPHAMFMWLGTLGRHRLQAELQPRDITLETIRRTCTAADDLDTLGAIAEAGPTSTGTEEG